ncbi:hypothetical protein K458DRAFT_387920 [Lentithecium fluviatile CBS 122367]|uniref:J domain-containing protein n=1 Tax=Lentithecium fluviatile CBS 122367 TaxID=1168545 RepID=A0A6G1J3P2_9PLEO|nr:hypothetical protein K458DRAFT_387920 [Lentithecium fluviatile CBS 122367]
MVGICYGSFKNVDVFGLLELDPRHFLGLPNDTILKNFRVAFRKRMLCLHPDRNKVSKATNLELSQQLLGLKEYLCDFKNADPAIVTRLVKNGCKYRRSTGAHRNRKTPAPRRTTSQPGSSPSNPVCLDTRGTSTTSDLGSSSNPIVIDAFPINAAPSEEGRKERKPTGHRKKHRTCRRWKGKDYDPSPGFKWRPAPYADQSDIESVWEADWDSDDHL